MGASPSSGNTRRRWCSRTREPAKSGLAHAAAWRCRWIRPTASLWTTFDRAPGHPDEGVPPSVGEVFEPVNLLETGPLVHGDRPAIERSDREGIALCPQRSRGETQAGAQV